MEETMQCSYLEGTRILSCRSMGIVYIPSLFELDEFCTQDRHAKCPFFCASPERERRALDFEVRAVRLRGGIFPSKTGGAR